MTGTIVYVQEIIQAEKYVNKIFLQVLNFCIGNVNHSFLWLWLLSWCEAWVDFVPSVCIRPLSEAYLQGLPPLIPWLILQLSNCVPAQSVSVLVYCTFSMSTLHQQHRLLRAITSQQLSLYIAKQRLFTLPPDLRMFSRFWHFDININLKQLVKFQIYLYSNWNLDKYFVTLTDKFGESSILQNDLLLYKWEADLKVISICEGFLHSLNSESS